MTGPGSLNRVLIYSHDSFGLGHLRRCRAIAHALVEAERDLSVLILSGSPIIGSFDFRTRVDFVRVPGMIKLRNGKYTSLNLHIRPEQTLAMRASIIRHTAEIFEPDIFIVDKEPLGLRGEVGETLTMLKQRGCRLILGLRDVMDEPARLAPEWRRKNVLPALQDLYDEIWVYGLPDICNPLDGLTLPDAVTRKIVFTGYLRRELPATQPAADLETFLAEPYILVTAGGGGDGEEIVDWVLRAYEADEMLPARALILFGPFMQPERQKDFRERAERLERRVRVLTFDAHVEGLIDRAEGVVAMGGYNTFCEILSFDKRAIIVPRTRPRREQYIRAARAQSLGLVRMLAHNGRGDARRMARALHALAEQPRPSEVHVPGLLDGLDRVHALVAPWMHRQPGVRYARA
ncbi:MAG: glycosyltransferase family protein [Alphaproteobacteria bacterium]